MTPMKIERTRKSRSSRVGAMRSMVAERLSAGLDGRRCGGWCGMRRRWTAGNASVGRSRRDGLHRRIGHHCCSTAEGLRAMRSRSASSPVGEPQT